MLSLAQHMAAELQRKKIHTTILAMHPGEVTTFGALYVSMIFNHANLIKRHGQCIGRMGS